MKGVAAAAAAVLLAAALAAGGFAGWLRCRDPVAALPRESGDPPAIEELIERRGGRSLARVTLAGTAVGTVRFFVSRPDLDPAWTGRIPLVIVVPGRRTGPEALSILGEPGPNAIAWFVWPFPDDVRWGRGLARRLPGLYANALSVPGQLSALVRWASRQRWLDRERVSLLGYSLGALVAPAAQRLCQEHGDPIAWTVLAYGGAPIGAVLEALPRIRDSPLRPALRLAADLLLRPVEPSVHLPALRGRFLLLGGTADESIPREAAERMREQTPQPRTVILFEGDHIGLAARQRELLGAVVAATKSWLVEQGAIDETV